MFSVSQAALLLLGVFVLFVVFRLMSEGERF